jgi:hypothetical protein
MNLNKIISYITLLLLFIPRLVFAEDIQPLVKPNVENATPVLYYGLVVVVLVLAGGLYWAWNENVKVMKQLKNNETNK